MSSRLDSVCSSTTRRMLPLRNPARCQVVNPSTFRFITHAFGRSSPSRRTQRERQSNAPSSHSNPPLHSTSQPPPSEATSPQGPQPDSELSSGGQRAQSAETTSTQPASSSTSSSPEVPANIAQVFPSRKWNKIPKKNAPKLNESKPLSLFFHADVYLLQTVKKLLKSKDGSSEKFKRRLEIVHRAQKTLLDSLWLIYVELEEAERVNKAYRQLLPYEDYEELEHGFSENILFAAESISHGFRIRGIDSFTDSLKESAGTLCAALDALRYVFRHTSLLDGDPPYTSLPPVLAVLKDFDRSWADFEEKVCVAYYQLYISAMANNDTSSSPTRHSSPRRPLTRGEELDFATVVLSEALMNGLNSGVVQPQEISDYEPRLMLAIPRLAILNMLRTSPEIIPISDSKGGFRWFRGKAESFNQLSDEIRALTEEDLDLLEKKLSVGRWEEDQEVENSGDTETENEGSHRKELEGEQRMIGMKHIFIKVCSLADSLQSGRQAKEMNFILQKVFKMHQSSQ